MRIGFSTVARWLDEAASACTPAQLDELATRLAAARQQAEARASQLSAARAAAEAAAKAAGVSLEELLRIAPAGGKQPAKVRPKDSRKPYLDPFNPQSECYAISSRRGHKIPEWAERLIEQGWAVEELHYKRHAAALRARGQQPRYDAVARYKQLTGKA